jgi:hypothetical protein
MTLDPDYLRYENDFVRLISTRNIPKIKTLGFTLEEISEGREFNTYFWVAKELVNSGFAKYIEEPITRSDWIQIHFKERLNPAGPPTSLPEDFYSKVFQSFIQVKDEEDKKNLVNRMKARYRDILESRISKINRLASVEAVSPPRVLTKEEYELYFEIQQFIKNWRDKMQKLGED